MISGCLGIWGWLSCLLSPSPCHLWPRGHGKMKGKWGSRGFSSVVVWRELLVWECHTKKKSHFFFQLDGVILGTILFLFLASMYIKYFLLPGKPTLKSRWRKRSHGENWKGPWSRARISCTVWPTMPWIRQICILKESSASPLYQECPSPALPSYYACFLTAVFTAPLENPPWFHGINTLRTGGNPIPHWPWPSNSWLLIHQEIRVQTSSWLQNSCKHLLQSWWTV